VDTTTGATPQWVAFDLETTGLSPRSDRIIEIGAVRFTESGVIGTFSTLVDPATPIPLAVQRLCGIDDAMVQGAPGAAEAVAGLAEFADGTTLVAHSAAFDLGFCAAIRPDVFRHWACVDTLELSRIVLPAAPSHSLGELALRLELGHDRPHRALSDADATRLLLLWLQQRVESLDEHVRGRLARLCHGRAWATGALIERAANRARPPAHPPDGGRAGPRVLGPEPADPAEPVTGDRSLDPIEVARLLGPDGPVAQSEDGYELREGQQQMAMAVTQALNRGGCLLVEAGTGVGKSLAYLVPAREWAARRGETVVIATHTVPLQEQLAQRDLPQLERWRPLGVRSALLKGRGHYLSLRRLDRWLAAPDRAGGSAGGLDRLRFQLRCLVWVDSTATGDRAELRLAGPEAQLWEQVASTVDDCLGPACDNWRDQRCFMVRARAHGRRAAVLVVSHALLLADRDSGGAILPPYRHLVVDEAHRLEEAATAGASISLRAGDVLRVLDRLPPLDPATGLQLEAARLAVVRAFGACKGLLSASAGASGRGRTLALPEAVRQSPGWGPAQRALTQMVTALGTAAADLRSQDPGNVGGRDAWPQPANAAEELICAASALEAAAAAAVRVLAAAADRDGDEVGWLELEGDEQAVLHLAPVAVGARLRATVFDRCDTVVLTSATLTVGGSFGYVRERLQLPAAEELVVDSAYDYLRQALLCLPRPMPAPEDPRHTEVLCAMVADCARRLGGRTLVLFTAFAALRAAHAALRAPLEAEGLVLLGQGLDGTRQQLLRTFRTNPRTVLLGSATFWEGVDVPGDALQCVVINKLPFPVPSDPLFQARTRGCRDPFRSEALPQAVLRLRQGFGRLVRTTTDRGAVILCDPRVLTRDYGPELLRALPRAATAIRAPAEVGQAVADFLAGQEVAP